MLVHPQRHVSRTFFSPYFTRTWPQKDRAKIQAPHSLIRDSPAKYPSMRRYPPCHPLKTDPPSGRVVPPLRRGMGRYLVMLRSGHDSLERLGLWARAGASRRRESRYTGEEDKQRKSVEEELDLGTKQEGGEKVGSGKGGYTAGLLSPRMGSTLESCPWGVVCRI
jgi:hypothetical protein